MPLAPPIDAIQQPAVGIYGLPVGASAGAMVLLTAAQIRAHADLGTLATQSGTFSGTSSGTNTGDQSLAAYATTSAVATSYVPYTGATGAVTLGANALTCGAITASGQSLTGSQTTPQMNLTATWNTTGIATQILTNLTDTTSATASCIVDNQVGGVSQFAVRKNYPISDGTSTWATVTRGVVTGLYYGNAAIAMGPGASNSLFIFGGFSAGVTTSISLGLSILIAPNNGLTEQRRGTNAQLSTIEKTYTSATSREYIQTGWNATDSAYDVGVSYQGSAGGSLQPVRIGNRTAAGVFAGLTVATTGTITTVGDIVTPGLSGFANNGLKCGGINIGRGGGVAVAGEQINMYVNSVRKLSLTGTQITASSDFSLNIRNNVSNAAGANDCSLIRNSTTQWAMLADTGLAIRNFANSADAAFTCAAITASGLIKPQQATTAGAPAYVLGAIYFDTTLNKLRIGGASAWETVTSV